MKLLLAKIWKFLHLSKNVQLLVMSLFQDQFLVGVTGIIFSERSEILLFKHTYRQIPWSLPGGYIKAKEHPSEGLEREILEESGLTVSIDERLKIRTDRESARLDICYIGTFIAGTFKPSHEVSEAALFTFEQLPLLPERQLLLIEQAIKQKRRISSQETIVSPLTHRQKLRTFFDKFHQL